MSIALAVAVITVMAVTIYLNITLNHHIADTNMEIEHLKFMSEFNQKLDDSIDKDLDLAEIKINAHQESIDEITARLEEIAKDIKRLDERTDADHKNLVDVRERYVLFRTPTTPAENSGVEWAKDIKCGEDNNE